MDSKATSIKGRNSGAGLAEYVVAMGVAMLVLMVAVGLSIFTGNSFMCMGHLVEMNEASRQAMDSMSREIRQADKVLGLTAGGSQSQITFQSGTNIFAYTHSQPSKTISRISNGKTQVLLRDVRYARCDLFQRNTTNGTYDYYPTANTNTCKVVRLTWVCSRSFLGRSPAVAQQSAKIVLRNQR